MVFLSTFAVSPLQIAISSSSLGSWLLITLTFGQFSFHRFFPREPEINVVLENLMFCPSILQNNRCGKVGCKLVNILCNSQLYLFLARKVLMTYFTLSSTISLEKWTTKTTFERRMYCVNGVIRTLFVRTWCGMVGIYLNC